MENRFQYLLDQLAEAQFERDPFPHLYLTNFLSEVDFKDVVTSEDVDLPTVRNLDELFTKLDKASYVPISFPGCTTSRREYRRWIEVASKPRATHKACEGQGMALRLKSPRNDAVHSLNEFFRSEEFQTALRKRFGISSSTRVEAGLQKYLHGYEISPHPDIRLKALTWMLNVNPAVDSERLNFHTHYLTLKPEWAYLASLWEHNPTVETCWVPWDWCTSVKQQTENNSIVIFSPRWDTMHAVRAHYNHLVTQRTQFYGNLWYEESTTGPYSPQFQDFDFVNRRNTPSRRLVRKLERTVKTVKDRRRP